MNKMFGASLLAISLMVTPVVGVYANEGNDANVKPEKVSIEEGKRVGYRGSCVGVLNQKRETAMRVARAAHEAAMKTAKTTRQTENRAAKALTDEHQRDLAMEVMQIHFEDAQVAADAASRVARRAADHQVLLDKKACRDQVAQKESCLKTAQQKMQDAHRAAMSTYEQSVKDAKAKLEADRAAAKLLTEGSARETAMRNAENAFEEARYQAESVARQTKRDAQVHSQADRQACVATVAR